MIHCYFVIVVAIIVILNLNENVKTLNHQKMIQTNNLHLNFINFYLISYDFDCFLLQYLRYVIY